MQKGWIKIYRELIDKPIWAESTPEQKTILITLLCMANHEEKEWEWKGRKYVVKPGQMITSLPSIAKKSGRGISAQNVRTALNRFKVYEFLTDESTNKSRLITIVNWGKYQAKEYELTGNLTGSQQAENEENESKPDFSTGNLTGKEGEENADGKAFSGQENNELTDDLTGGQQAANRQLTPNKNVKNVKNVKKNNKKTSRRANKFDDQQMTLANKLLDLIHERLPDLKQPNLESWANEIRIMMEREKRTVRQIEYLIEWSQQDPFWSTNVLSPSGLRRNFDKMVAQIKADKQKKSFNSNQQQNDEFLKRWRERERGPNNELG
ncbi:hypothetical protein OYT88_11790 [Sporolactobacillus sp. CQH2019]|uniref:hypothetical protein n=1 Tax=Sporolactobacillus sp. CQH2019 TaxID=3023512 RepID=UPI002367C29E|nr:hypothetical protein [Sporolactobacillus sp. CQH2019]MDD9149235.1 hypothetical protein [Sporolactobacillus sp. CQH2019]